MITKEDVFAFFDSNPAIKISVIEKEAGIPASTINKARDGSRELNGKHLGAIYPILRKYGFREGLYDQAKVISVVNHKGELRKQQLP